MEEPPSPPRALIVDDQEDVVSVLGLILQTLGFDVAIAADGYHAVELARRVRFDVVLTDLRMPGLSGWEVADRLRRLQPRPRVVLVTGWLIDTPEEELRARGVDALLLKPFSCDEVATAVLGYVLDRRGGGGLEEASPAPTSRR